MADYDFGWIDGDKLAKYAINRPEYACLQRHEQCVNLEFIDILKTSSLTNPPEHSDARDAKGATVILFENYYASNGEFRNTIIMGDDYRRCYNTPGGTRDPGERIKQTALRECVEEIGIAVPHNYLHLAAVDHYGDGTKSAIYITALNAGNDPTGKRTFHESAFLARQSCLAGIGAGHQYREMTDSGHITLGSICIASYDHSHGNCPALRPGDTRCGRHFCNKALSGGGVKTGIGVCGIAIKSILSALRNIPVFDKYYKDTIKEYLKNPSIKNTA